MEKNLTFSQLIQQGGFHAADQEILQRMGDQ